MNALALSPAPAGTRSTLGPRLRGDDARRAAE